MDSEQQQQRLAAITKGGRAKRPRAREQEPRGKETVILGSTSATGTVTSTQLDIPAELLLVLQALTSKTHIIILCKTCVTYVMKLYILAIITSKRGTYSHSVNKI